MKVNVQADTAKDKRVGKLVAEHSQKAAELEQEKWLGTCSVLEDDSTIVCYNLATMSETSKSEDEDSSGESG